MIIFLVQILLAWFLADFLTGLVHWIEDKYLDSSKFAIIDDIAKNNDIHHEKPTTMLLTTPWSNIKQSAYVAWPLSIVLFLFGAHLILWLGVAFASLGNLIHRWAHTPAKQLHPAIKIMQKTGLFISYKEHDLHHRSMLKLIPKHLAGYKYCTMTNYVNFLLDNIKFWDGLELALSKVGIKTIKEKKDIDA
jgi:Lipid desaturase domain